MRSILPGLLLFIALVGNVGSVVHEIKAKHVPSSQPRSITRPTLALDAARKSLSPKNLGFFKSQAAGAINVNLTYDLIGEIQIGRPGQNFRTHFHRWETNAYFLASNATFPIIGDYKSKAKYNQSASSTAIETGRPFTGPLHTFTGRIVNEEINLGSAKSRADVGIVDHVRIHSQIGYFPWDAEFGLGIPDNDAVTNISALTQAAKDWDKPILTTYTSSKTEQGQITFGGEDNKNCESKYVYTPRLNVWLDAHINSASLGNKTVPLQGTVEIYYWHTPIYVTAAAAKLFVEATEAKYSYLKGLYEVDCDQSKNKARVVFHLGENGETPLELVPEDYVAYSDDYGVCYLNIEAIYPSSSHVFIGLGQNFLDNHCFAQNIREKTVGFAPVKKRGNVQPNIEA